LIFRILKSAFEFLAAPPEWFGLAVTFWSLVGIWFLFRAAMKDNAEAVKRAKNVRRAA
jgi:hypothetical protein